MFGVDGLVSTFCTGWQSQGQAGEGGGVSHVLSIQDGHGWGCVRLRWLRVQCTGVQWSRTADRIAILFLVSLAAVSCHCYQYISDLAKYFRRIDLFNTKYCTLLMISPVISTYITFSEDDSLSFGLSVISGESI